MSLESCRTGSRTVQESVKAAGIGPEQQPWSDQRTGGVCVGDMSGSASRVSGETCASGLDPTGGASLATGKAAAAGIGVGDLHRSVDLWESQREQREVTCCAVEAGSAGQGDGPQGLPTPDKVRKLQVTLYRKAQVDVKHRFWSLYGEVMRADVLATAWARVAANGGGAGVDGQTIEAIRIRQERWLGTLREELKARMYRPEAVRRVMIPKAGGGQRLLGIPTVKDRVVQMAVYLVLMPIFEADFHPRSFGFRPGRSAHEAVAAIREGLRMGKMEVVDADLSRYFDTIPHRQLLRQVARRVSDGAILKLLRAWLRAPIEDQDERGCKRRTANRSGTPQGGVISPLLANVYLNRLDHAVNEQCREKPRMVRYADDLVILCRPGEGAGMKARLERWLEAAGLKLNEAKTRVVRERDESFEFLGFRFQWRLSRKRSWYVHTEPSPKSRQQLRNAVREVLQRRTTWRATAEVVKETNQIVRGWGNYFALGHHGDVFDQMNYWLTERLRRWLWRKHANASGKYKRWPSQVLYESHGLYELPNTNFVRPV
jgi:RNA-directed DNA polymerase